MKIGKIKKGKYEYYRIQFTDSFNRKREITGKTRKEVKEKYEKCLRENTGTVKGMEKMTVEEFFYYYLFEVLLPSESVKGKTFDAYVSIYKKHIKNSLISKVIISDLRKEHLQKYFNKKKNKYKSNSIRTIKAFISSVLSFAENEDIILKNYMKGVKLKQEIEKEKEKLLTDEEIEKLLKYLEKDIELSLIVKIALSTGMRINEILSLTEEDIGIDKCAIAVSKTASRHRDYTENKIVSVNTLPKTKNSFRVAYFPASLKKDLTYFIKYVKEKYLKRGLSYNKQKPLFINRNNRACYNIDFTPRINKAYKALDMEFTGFHILRHTYISKMYKQGISQKLIQQQVGHNSVAMSMHYTHTEKAEQLKAAQAMNKYFES